MSDPQPRREPTAVARDVVAELAHQHPDELADFWRKTPEQQTNLIEQFGTSPILSCGSSEMADGRAPI
jgi:hypothetical protein